MGGSTVYIIYDCHYTDGFEKLQLGKVVGQGSFGTVYKAVWKGVIVAAKHIQIQEGTKGYGKLIEEVEMTRYKFACIIMMNYT